MTKWTNALNLPAPIVAAITNDPYSSGDADISVTSLIAPARQRELMRLHKDELEEDVADRIFALLGQSVHSILERANATGIAERRLSMDVLGWKISGGMDLVHDNGKLTDYKVTSVWQFLDGKVPDSFVQQLNIYAELLRENGLEVNRLEVVGVLRDWSKMEAMRNDGLPRHQVVVRQIPMWEPAFTRVFIADRVHQHQEARKALPECTPEERWARPDVYAVMKEGRKSAVKLYNNDAEAQLHVAGEKGLSVVKRPGMSVRCAGYCSVSGFCTQYAAIQKETSNEISI